MPSSQNSNILLVAHDLSVSFRIQEVGHRNFRELFTDWKRILCRGNSGKKVDAVRNVSITINNGDRLGILGRNGSGKTTLCRVLSGIYQPHSGRVNRYVRILPLFRSLGLPEEDLSGGENAQLLALMLFGSMKKARIVAPEAIHFAELEEFAHIPVRYYSDGMRARLLLSVVTSVSAELLILDEALGSADATFSEKFTHRISSTINSAAGLILVSHNEEEIRRYCNRVIVYDAGTIAFQGCVEDAIQFYHGLHG